MTLLLPQRCLCHINFCVEFWSIPDTLLVNLCGFFLIRSAFSVEFSFTSALTFVSRVFK